MESDLSSDIEKRLKIETTPLGSGALAELALAARLGEEIESGLTTYADPLILLPSGGFARVVRANLDGNVVALKVLLPQWCDPTSPQARAYQQHFIKEGRFLAQHKHP